MKRLIIRKISSNTKKLLKIFIGPFLVSAALFVIVVWQLVLPTNNRLLSANILGVTVGTDTGTGTQTTTGTTSVDTGVPTAVPVPTNTPTKAAVPTTAPTSPPIIIPTATPIIKPTVAPTSAPTQPPFVPPTATPVLPELLITPKPTGAIIYDTVITVPIGDYKTPSTGQTQPTLPAPTAQPTQAVSQTGETVPVTITPPIDTGTNLKSQPLIVETVNSSGVTTGTVTITSPDMPVRIENRNSQLAMNVTTQNGGTQQLSQDTFRQISNRLSEDSINIYTAGANNIIIRDGAVAAMTELPLSVSILGNIQVVLKTGTEDILTPYQAIDHLATANELTTIQGQATSVEEIKQLIRLVEYNHRPAYVIKGCKNKFFLALFQIPVCMELTMLIGEKDQNEFFRYKIVHKSENLVNRALDVTSL